MAGMVWDANGEGGSSSRGGRRQPGTKALTYALTAARVVAIVVLCVFIWPDVKWPVVAAFVALQVLSLDWEAIVERMREKGESRDL
jgi:hypothetical protein